jgi:hypothetical protein
MADVPSNQTLYALVVTQAKAKYRIYPSPGASHWVHRRYLELGGKFEDSEKIALKKELTKRAVKAAEEHDPNKNLSKKEFAEKKAKLAAAKNKKSGDKK